MDIRQLVAFCAVALLSGLVVAKCRKKREGQDTLSTLGSVPGKHHVEMKIKEYGVIKMELDGDSAPVTVTNFLTLVKRGFYNGLTFHRVIDGFMIQGGDPNHDGTGGSEQRIKGEFSENGVQNLLSHTRGAVSMARSSGPNSASSQFFIVQKDSVQLDGSYAVFGYVTEGIEIVDRICQETKIQDNDGTVEKENQPMIEEIKMID